MSTLVCQTQVALQNETLLVGPGHGRQICNHHSVTATLWSGCLAGGRRGAAAPSSDSHVRPAKCDCVHQSAALHPVPAQGQFVALHLLMLGCAVLYCAVLCCAVPCYASLRYAMLFDSQFPCTAPPQQWQVQIRACPSSLFFSLPYQPAGAAHSPPCTNHIDSKRLPCHSSITFWTPKISSPPPLREPLEPLLKINRSPIC